MGYSKPKKCSVRQLLQILPSDFYTSIAIETNVDKQVKHLFGYVFFKLLLYGVLTKQRLSTRVLENIYNSHVFKAFSDKGGHHTRHSSISDRLNTVNPAYFRSVYEGLRELVLKSKLVLSRQDYKLIRVDSTLVRQTAHHLKHGLETGNTGNKKEGAPTYRHVKYTTSLEDSLPGQAVVYLDQKYVSDNNAMTEFIQSGKWEDNSLFVFDRGITDRGFYDWMQDENKRFITRLKDNVLYKELETHANVSGKESQTLVFEKDIICALYKGRKTTRHNFRIIIARTKDDGKQLIFLTNEMDMDCVEVTNHYRSRWEIEEFYRFTKQELSLDLCINCSENGLQVMLWVRLIAALLILVYKDKNKIEGYKIARMRFEDELQFEIMKEIVKACEGNPELVDKLYLKESHAFW